MGCAGSDSAFSGRVPDQQIIFLQTGTEAYYGCPICGWEPETDYEKVAIQKSLLEKCPKCFQHQLMRMIRNRYKEITVKPELQEVT
jgi:NAD-dependent SIR2 family protein deacetylase